MNRVIEKLKCEENQKLRKFVAEKVIEQCEKEPAFVDKVLSNDKTLDDCIAYITSLAKKEATEGCAAIEDNTVRGWAIHYFDEKDLKFDLQTARVSTSNEKPKVQIKKPEKKEKKEKIVKEQLSLF